MTGITAERTDTGVQVSWSAVDGAARYIVYYSRSSILENAGAYEDFEVTSGPVTSVDLTLLPQGDMLYIAVLAENTAGEDSGVFTEEASVELGGAAEPHLWENASSAASVLLQSASSAQASSQAPVILQSSVSSSSASAASSSSAASPIADEHTFRVFTVQAITPTSIEVTFSSTVMLDPQDAPYAFTVHDARGTILPLQRLTIDGGRVTIDTYPQTEGSVYELTVGGVVRGLRMEGEQQVLLPLDPSTSRVLFTGMGVSAAVPALSDLEVRNLRLRAIPELEGQYTVEAQWIDPQRLDQVAGYIVTQSADGGRTALTANPIPRGTNTARIRGVTIENFGVRVQVVTPDGQITRGVFAPITLLGGIDVPVVLPPLSSSVSSVSSRSTSSAMSSSSSSKGGTNGGSLPQTGLPILALAGISGLAAHRIRRRLRR